MPHTPLSLDRVISDLAKRRQVQAVLDSIPTSSTEDHGVTIRLKNGTRVLVKWGEYPANGDALAQRIRGILSKPYQVSQCRQPSSWGKFRTATFENPYEH